MIRHQVVDRRTCAVLDEPLFADDIVRYVYSDIREHSYFLFNLITSKRMSSLISHMVYDFPTGARLLGTKALASRLGIDLTECLCPERLTTPRRLFERKIKFWQRRPMPTDDRAVVSPADARMLMGPIGKLGAIRIKEKFFSYGELLGDDRTGHLATFASGSFAVFRLTPEKYHWNHFPVSGVVEDVYELDGAYHSCNPAACIAVATPYSKNRRTVTVINTDTSGGTHVGRVAMIEVVALMIGVIEQRYSTHRYDDPCPATPGMFVEKGAPKSLYRPGSSVDILLFEKDRVAFSQDIVANLHRTDVNSRYTLGFDTPIVETDVAVRSEIGRRK